MSKIEVWFSFGSTYTFLTASRLKKVISEQSINFSLHPFSVRTVMKKMDNIPFPPSKKSKVDHMWRDIERRSEIYGIEKPKLPVPYPIKELDLANRVALVGVKNGWCLDYLFLSYKNWFYNHIEAGSDENLKSTFENLGLDFEKIKKEANSDKIIDEYENQTEKAYEIGVFGSPSFIYNNEVFWGDDRLEDAIRWSKK